MDTTPGLESVLWVRSLGGDSAAFGELFDRHRNRVFRHAFRLVRDVQAAEDVSATVFLELWRRRRHVRVVGDSILPWLLVTATYASRNAHRSARRYRAFIDSLPRDLHAPDAAEELLERQFLESVDPRLAAALRGLSPTDMQLFALVYLEDYPVAVAAAVLNLTPSAAKTRLHRARVRLRALLTDSRNPVPQVLARTDGNPS